MSIKLNQTHFIRYSLFARNHTSRKQANVTDLSKAYTRLFHFSFLLIQKYFIKSFAIKTTFRINSYHFIPELNTCANSITPPPPQHNDWVKLILLLLLTHLLFVLKIFLMKFLISGNFSFTKVNESSGKFYGNILLDCLGMFLNSR